MPVSARYIVDDIDTVLPFYVEGLGFTLTLRPAPGFAALTRGDLQLYLNQPGAGGAGQPADDGSMPGPGGWNRIQIEVTDVEAVADELQRRGFRLRTSVVAGAGGKQALAEDPAGNPVELFQPYA